MKTVNYHIIGEIFGLLERIELLDEIQFGDFDPDDETDAIAIAERFIAPSLAETTEEKKEQIRWAIEYYSTTGTANHSFTKSVRYCSRVSFRAPQMQMNTSKRLVKKKGK